ncbi:MAG TPA: FHA domain-containing protein [Thermomicrobiales bacterium]|jgi:pSer/pThr/pTyr-binding forkhead associated (FHA) protein
MAEPFVVQIERGTGTGTRFTLGATATIGRQQGLEITVQDTQASRQHARLEVREERVLLTDLGAANGTFVNNERISGVVALLPGDTIQVGETTLRLLGATVPQVKVVAADPPQAQTVVATPPPVASPVAVTAADMPRLGQGGPPTAIPASPANRMPLLIGLGIGTFLLLCICVATVLALVAR